MKLIVHQRENDRLLAIEDGGRFLEFDMDSNENEAIVGAIYCGRVIRVTPDYALIDVDRSRPAFLQSPSGIKEGDHILVQVKREELDDMGEAINGNFKKGLVVTQNLQLVTPYFVYAPNEKGIAFAKTVKDSERLTKLGSDFLKENTGKFIFRSKADRATEINLWNAMELMDKTWGMTKIMAKKPSFLFAGRRHIERLLDQYMPKEIYTDSINAYWDIQSYLSTYPYPADVINRQHNVFEEFHVGEEWDTLVSPWIKTSSGGNLTIETTTTFTCIDVNQGSSTLSLDALNKEAAKMLPDILLKMQLNGNVIVDFAGTVKPETKEFIMNILEKALPKDALYLSWSGMGWLEVRRPRTRKSLLESLKYSKVAA